MKAFLILILIGVTAGMTMIVRMPIPGTGGYLNLGDMAVVFASLFLGGRWGAVVGGVGSATADLIGGFVLFAPVTLIAKGLEGFIAGTLGKKHLVWVLLAVFVMVVIYFLAELFLPGMGQAAALSELPFNAIQAVVGAIGGVAVYKGVMLALPQSRGGSDGKAK